MSFPRLDAVLDAPKAVMSEHIVAFRRDAQSNPANDAQPQLGDPVSGSLGQSSSPKASRSLASCSSLRFVRMSWACVSAKALRTRSTTAFWLVRNNSEVPRRHLVTHALDE